MRVLEGGEVARRREHQHRRAAQGGVAGHEVQQFVGVEGDQVEVEDDRRRRVVLQHPHGARIAQAGGDVVARPERLASSLSSSVSSSMIARVLVDACRHRDLPPGLRSQV